MQAVLKGNSSTELRSTDYFFIINPLNVIAFPKKWNLCEIKLFLWVRERTDTDPIGNLRGLSQVSK